MKKIKTTTLFLNYENEYENGYFISRNVYNKAYSNSKKVLLF
jgi:hypothetical protein